MVGACAANTPSLPDRPVITSGVRPSLAARPNFAFSCDPQKYIKPQIVTIAPNHHVWLPSFKAHNSITYYAVAGLCGVESSFLGKDQVLLTTFHTHTLKLNTIDTSIEVVNGSLAGKSDIAVWEEAWFENWLRLPSEDAHVALVHVQP
jgi:hypothetical protein